jgi:Kelch motif protein
MRAMRLALAAVFVLPLAAAACTRSGAQQCPSLARPSARSEVDAVLVPATNQIYALGGQGPNAPIDEMWRYSFGACGGWTHLALASTPGPRAGYTAALDNMRDRIVYIGGAATNDLWALNTDDLTFTKLAPTGNPPVVAKAEIAAYDDMNDRIIYAGIETWALQFGNSDQGQWVFNDPTSLQAPASGALDPTRSLLIALDNVGMHAFNLLTSTWHDVAMSGEVPPAGAVLVWDDVGEDMIAVADSVYVGEFDALANLATFAALATTGDPPPRTSFAAAVTGNTLWLSGGVNAAGCTLDDLWTLDLTSKAWTNVWPATTCM